MLRNLIILNVSCRGTELDGENQFYSRKMGKEIGKDLLLDIFTLYGGFERYSTLY
jgi:hypothetical protein